MPAITLYIKQDVQNLLEKERERRHLSSKPQAASKIIEEYFRRKGFLEEED